MMMQDDFANELLMENNNYYENDGEENDYGNEASQPLSPYGNNNQE